MNIIEAIRQRKSVRTYNPAPLSPDQITSLNEIIRHTTTPFGGRVDIRVRQFDAATDYRPSTYGMIRGASAYFIIGTGSDEASAISTGYRFEQVVLKAWQMGLGTCWIAATFKHTAFDSAVEWPDGVELRLVSPVGIAAAKPSLLEKISRMAVKADRRRPFETLFFLNGFHTPLSPHSIYGEALEMMRLAPSSTNSQPWRAVVSEGEVHFYYVDKSRLAPIDCGIGLCHFHLAEQFRGHQGNFAPSSDAPTAPPGLRYLTSYHR